MNAPSGTITFLFTDMEGSTKLWEAQPDAMRGAVARHDALLRQAVDANNGYLFKTTGDGIAAAFAIAADGLAAALAAQQALAAEPWPEAAALRSRMGLHTGSAEWRDGDYFGQTLNRAARLMAAGHGGQTLVSDVTHELCRDSLPPGVTLLPKGEQRLKDLARPETVFQLAHPQLAANFPPLRTLDVTPNNLPQQVTSFVGREKPLADVAGLLGKTRLLTLTGSGGSGKTRLSLQATADALDGYPDGAWLVELAALADPWLVPQTVASALGLREQAGQSLTQTLTDFLKPRRLLLVLDNCEHVLSACAVLVAALMRACPVVKVLATSREPLGIAGELTYRVPSLSLPGATLVKTATPASLNQFESVRLFIERAQFAKSDFSVTNANAPSLAQICCRLDGIPLAIELAAARVRSLTVAQINDKLDSRFRLLTGGDRSALPRQQTLSALIDWSYDLLTDSEKTLLARLSVFAGGWTLEAAESVCGFDPLESWEILDLLASLVDKSLVLAEESSNAIRYGMLETVHRYSLERLEAAEELAQMRNRHVDWSVLFPERAWTMLETPDQSKWLNCLENEHDNLRVSLDRCAANAITVDPGGNFAAANAALTGLRLANMLFRFWMVRGYVTEGRELLGRALQVRKDLTGGPVAVGIVGSKEDQDSTKKEVAWALRAAGILAWSQSDYIAARLLLEECLGLCREIGAQTRIAVTLMNLGNVALYQSDYTAAKALYEESLILFRELGDKDDIAHTLSNLGLIAADQGDYLTAQGLYQEGLSRLRETGDKGGIASALTNLGNVAVYQGDYVLALSQLEESLKLHRETGDKSGIADTLASLGNVAAVQKRFAMARAYYVESLCLFDEIGERNGTSLALSGMATVFDGEAKKRRAVVLWATAQALRESIGSPPPVGSARIDPGKSLSEARTALDDEDFASACAEGRAMNWEQAVEFALGGGE